MEIHIQQCQQCNSTKLKNILYRESGEPDRVYVQCHDCESFVASYVISPMGYYHNGKGYESFLRGMLRSGGFMSGRRVKRLFTERSEGEQLAFKDIIEKLRIQEEKRQNKEESD